MKSVVPPGFSAPLVLSVLVMAFCGSAPESVSVAATASAEDPKEKLVEAIDKTGIKASVPGKNPANAPKPAAEPVGLVSLADSLQPLQDRFDELRDRPHFVAILSPT